jgi:2'-5' RNA ligase
MARLFVAVWPPPAIVETLQAIRRPVMDGVRWTTPDQWHVTMRFLGTMEIEPALVAFSALNGQAGAEASLGPGIRRLSGGAITVDVRGLDDLATAVRLASPPIGGDERRPFRGHLTLARVKGTTRSPRIEPMASGEWPVRSLTLVRSVLRPEGAQYEIVASAPLTLPDASP